MICVSDTSGCWNSLALICADKKADVNNTASRVFKSLIGVTVRWRKRNAQVFKFSIKKWAIFKNDLKYEVFRIWLLSVAWIRRMDWLCLWIWLMVLWFYGFMVGWSHCFMAIWVHWFQLIARLTMKQWRLEAIRQLETRM